MSASDTLAPASLGDGPTIALTDAELDAAQEGKLFPVPPDWNVVHGHRSTLVVGFSSASDLDVPAEAGMFPPTLDGSEPKILEVEEIPVTYLTLERGAEICSVEIITTTTTLARVWSRSVTGGGTMRATPAGRVGAGGPTALIDTDDQLIRAVYSDGEVESSGKADDYRRMALATDQAKEFMEAVVELAA